MTRVRLRTAINVCLRLEIGYQILSLVLLSLISQLGVEADYLRTLVFLNTGLTGLTLYLLEVWPTQTDTDLVQEQEEQEV